MKFLLFFISFLLVLACQVQATFTASTVSLVAVENCAIALGDYNNDGYIDIAIAGNNAVSLGRITKIYRNNGNMSFTALDDSLTGVDDCDLAWGDYDNDGDLDLAVAGANSATSRILKIYTNTNGTFSELSSFSADGIQQCSIAWVDYDNDCDLDLSVCGTTDGAATGTVTRIYKNSAGSFASDSSVTITAVRDGQLAWADYDNDGDLDIAISGKDTNNNYVLKFFKNANGAFTEDVQSLTGLYSSALSWADYDQDGNIDLIGSGNSTAGRLTNIYRNVSGNFSTTVISLTGTELGRSAWGDYDNDGDLDLAICGKTDGTVTATLITQIYRNSSGSFSSAVTLTGLQSASLAFADFDNDGDIDIITAGQNSTPAQATTIYTNDQAATKANTVPSPPSTGISSKLSGVVISLQWDAGSDSESPNQLFYQVKMGTTSGGQDVITGVYGSPLFGNYLPAKTTSTFFGLRLTSFPSKKMLFWSIKTIDANFKESSWSTEYAIYSGGSLYISTSGGGISTSTGKETTVSSGIITGSDNSPVSGVPIKFTVTKPDNTTVVLTASTNSSGIATAALPSYETKQIGIYKLQVEGNNISLSSQEITFVITSEESVNVTVAPNPFTPTKAPWDKVSFIITNRNTAPAELKIFDLSSRLVNSFSFLGTENVEWNGKDSSGTTVEGGIYIWLLKINNVTYSGTVVLIR